MSYRERVLWEVAERYHEFTDPLNGPSGVPGSGELPSRMPWTYTATVREFERLLGVMRGSAGQDWFRDWRVLALRWHLLEWHLKAERVVRQEVVTRTVGRRVVVLLDAAGEPLRKPAVGVRRHPGAVEGRARDAVAWMAEGWGLACEPELPVDPEERRRRVSAVSSDEPVVVAA